MSEEAHIVQLRNVTVTGAHRAHPELDAFSLAIAAGETVGLLGEEGCGKEAVLRLLGSFARQGDTVTGLIDWRGVTAEKPGRNRPNLRTAYLPAPSARSLAPHASVESQLVRVVARKRAVARAVAVDELHACLERLNGAPSWNELAKKPGELAPAQLAWALLAAASACKPELLLALDATADLGPVAAGALATALREEQHRLGFALVYAASTIPVARRLGGRIVVIRDGRVVEEGTVERLAGPNAHEYTRSLFRTVTALSAEKPLKSPARGETLLRVQNLDLGPRARAKRGTRDGITFELRRGASLALIGEHGAGRRALARAVLGLDRPAAGRVVLDAVDLSVLSQTMIARLRRRIAFITGSDAALDPRMTLWDTVDEPLHAHLGLSGALSAGYREAALKRVGLATRNGRLKVAALSAFDKRRLQIARAIVSAPLLAVVDEPLRGLDAFAQAILRELLVDFRAQEGPAFLVITSDFSVAQALADEAMVLKDRHVIERGPVHDIIRAPKNDYTRKLIDAVRAPAPATLPKADATV